MTPIPVTSDVHVRDDLHLEAQVALDHAESLYRALQSVDAAALALPPNALNAITLRAKAAYYTLAAIRDVTDWRRKS